MAGFLGFVKKKVAAKGIELEFLADAWRIGPGESAWFRARVLENGRPMARLPWRKVIFTLVEAPSGVSFGIGSHHISRAGESLQRGIDSSGFARARLTAGSRPGKVMVKASWSSKVNMVSLEKTYDILVAPAPEPEPEVVEPEHFLSLSADERSVPADGKHVTMVTARITDQAGDPIPYQKVSFYIESFTERGVVFDAGHVDFQISNRDDSLNVIFGDGGGALPMRTDENGNARVKFTSGIARGVARICALHIQPGKVPGQKYLDIGIGGLVPVSWSVSLAVSPSVLRLEGDYSDLIAEVQKDGRKSNEPVILSISDLGGTDAYLTGPDGRRCREVRSNGSGAAPRIVAGKKSGSVSVRACLASDPAVSASASLQVKLAPLLLEASSPAAPAPQASPPSIALAVTPPFVESEGGSAMIDVKVSSGTAPLAGRAVRFSIQGRHGCGDAIFLESGNRFHAFRKDTDENGLVAAELKFGSKPGKVKVRVSLVGEKSAYADTEIGFSHGLVPSDVPVLDPAAVGFSSGVFSVHIVSGSFDKYTDSLSASLTRAGIRVVVFIPIDAPENRHDWDLLYSTYKPKASVRGVLVSPLFGRNEFIALFLERNGATVCMIVSDYSKPEKKDPVINSAIDFLYANRHVEVPNAFNLNGPFAMLSFVTASRKYHVPCLFTVSGHAACVDANVLSELDGRIARGISDKSQFFVKGLLSRELACIGVADAIILPSDDYSGARAAVRLPASFSKQAYLYNVSKGSFVPWPLSHDVVRSRLLRMLGVKGLPADAPILFFPAGGFDVLSGADVAALSIPALVAANPDALFIFRAASSEKAVGSMEKRLAADFDELGRRYRKNVLVLKGRLSDAEASMFCAGSDFGVMPYVHKKAAGFAAASSLFHGTPVIATSVGGLGVFSSKRYLGSYFYDIPGLGIPRDVAFFNGAWSDQLDKYREYQLRASAAFTSAVNAAISDYRSGRYRRLERRSADFGLFAAEFSSASVPFLSAYELVVSKKADALGRMDAMKQHLLSVPGPAAV